MRPVCRDGTNVPDSSVRGSLGPMAHGALPQYIPSPPINSFHIGPLDVHFYALGYIIGITLAILITRRRWRALGGDPDLVNDIALWGVPPASSAAGSTSTSPRPTTSRTTGTGPSPCGPAASASGRRRAGRLVGVWRLQGSASPSARSPTRSRPRSSSPRPSAASATTSTRNCSASRPRCRGAWRSRTVPGAGGIPAQDLHFATFQPTFLYELIWDLALAAFLVWLGHHARIRPWSLFALYVAGYSAYRIFEETTGLTRPSTSSACG